MGLGTSEIAFVGAFERLSYTGAIFHHSLISEAPLQWWCPEADGSLVSASLLAQIAITPINHGSASTAAVELAPAISELPRSSPIAPSSYPISCTATATA